MIHITTHNNPDGDAIGVAFGAYELLARQGKHSVVHLWGEKPRWFTAVWEYIGHPPFTDEPVPEGAHVWLLDAPHFGRCGEGNVPEDVRLRLLVDHHPVHDPTEHMANASYLSEGASSACELLTGLAMAEDWPISAEAATWLALGMATDSLNFSTDKTSFDTHHAMMKLYQAGAQVTPIRQLIHKSMTFRLLAFQSHALRFAQSLGDVMIVSLGRSDRSAFGVNESDAKVVLYPASQLIDINLIIFVYEGDGDYTLVSARGKGAQEVCRAVGGGGHHTASGAKTALPMADVLMKIHEVIRER